MHTFEYVHPAFPLLLLAVALYKGRVSGEENSVMEVTVGNRSSAAEERRRGKEMREEIKWAWATLDPFKTVPMLQACVFTWSVPCNYVYNVLIIVSFYCSDVQHRFR